LIFEVKVLKKTGTRKLQNMVENRAKYVYGILNTNGRRSFGNIGIRNEEVYTINFNDISAVVADSQLKRYEVTRDNLLAHERAIRAVMQADTIIPMTYGTVAKDDKEVESMLARMYLEFKQVLAKIENKLQIDVKAIWNRDIIYAGILREDEDIKRLSERVRKKPADNAYNERVELGKKVMSVLNNKKKTYIGEVNAALSTYISDSQQNKLADEQMIMNTSFLVDKANEKAVYNNVDELDEKYGDDVQVVAVGPLPPYNFTHIEIKKMDFETIASCRRILSINKEATISEIEEAYNRMALQFHPDRNPDPSATDKFKEIERAYSTLNDYCSRYVYSFRRKDVEKTLMVRK
jgi:hypothetical protein